MRKIVTTGILTTVMMFGMLSPAQADHDNKFTPKPLTPVESSYTADPPKPFEKNTKIGSFCRHKSPAGTPRLTMMFGLECWIEVWAPNHKTANRYDGTWRYIGTMDACIQDRTCSTTATAPLLPGTNVYRTAAVFWRAGKGASHVEYDRVSKNVSLTRHLPMVARRSS